MEEYPFSDDDEREHRKPIGWNFQSMSFPQESPLDESMNNDDDDIEVIEVKASDSPQTQRKFPKSSTRQEISEQLRGLTQSKIGNFFLSKPSEILIQNTENSSNVRKRKIDDNLNEGNESKTSSSKNVLNSAVNHQTSKKIKTSKTKNESSFIKDNSTTKCNSLVTKHTNGEIKPDDKSIVSTSVPSIGKKVELTTVSSVTSNPSTSREENKVADEDHEVDSETSLETLNKFIRRWKSVKEDKDNDKIHDKIIKYYHLSHSSFTCSKKFLSQVESSTDRVSVDNVYVLIKDILDSLKRYRDNPYRVKPKKSLEEKLNDNQNNIVEEPATEEEKKKLRKLRKIEKSMLKISKKIKELDEAECDLDDENSPYLVQERLKRQFMKLDDYYCRLAECSPATGRPVERRFRYEGSRYKEINKRITAWVNKHREFPDYVEIMNLVKKVTKDSNLPLRPETVRVQAQEIFRDVGQMLKQRRENDDMYSIYAYGSDGPDPADQDSSLATRLDENQKIASENLEKVFVEFVDKQMTQKEELDVAAASNAKSGDTSATDGVNKVGENDAKDKPDSEENKETNENTLLNNETEDDIKKNSDVEKEISTSITSVNDINSNAMDIDKQPETSCSRNNSGDETDGSNDSTTSYKSTELVSSSNSAEIISSSSNKSSASTNKPSPPSDDKENNKNIKNISKDPNLGRTSSITQQRLNDDASNSFTSVTKETSNSSSDISEIMIQANLSSYDTDEFSTKQNKSHSSSDKVDKITSANNSSDSDKTDISDNTVEFSNEDSNKSVNSNNTIEFSNNETNNSVDGLKNHLNKETSPIEAKKAKEMYSNQQIMNNVENDDDDIVELDDYDQDDEYYGELPLKTELYTPAKRPVYDDIIELSNDSSKGFSDTDEKLTDLEIKKPQKNYFTSIKQFAGSSRHAFNQTPCEPEIVELD